MTPAHQSPPQAVVLVGGLGTRLKTVLGEQTPKALAEINGRPFLWYLFRYLQGQEINSVVLATAHLSEAIRLDSGRFVPDGVHVEFSLEQSPRGTGGAVVEALPLIQSDPFLVMNGDSFVDVPLGAMIAEHSRQKAIATIGLVEVEDCARFGTVASEENGTITAFTEKQGIAAPGWINSGVYVLSKGALTSILNREVSSIERDIFPSLVGHGLRGFKVSAPFIDIGVPESYEAAGRFFAEAGHT